MTTTEPTPVEIEAGAQAVERYEDEECVHISACNGWDESKLADGVLRAVLPDHDARVRADERERIARAIEDTTRRAYHWRIATARAAAIARAHSTGEDTDHA